MRGFGLRSPHPTLNTTAARLVFYVFGALAEFERSLVWYRTRVEDYRTVHPHPDLGYRSPNNGLPRYISKGAQYLVSLNTGHRRASKRTFVLFIISVAWSFVPASGQIPATSKFLQPALYLGTAWYPEQWPESRWNADLTLMQKAGIRFVRIGEFSWSRLEPEEGQLRFGWLDRAIEEAAHYGINTVLATPTAAPPVWLTQKYPETLRVDVDGSRDAHGNPGHFNWANETYRRLTRRIVEEMAEHYGRNPHVIGWQIDNEYRAISYDSDTKTLFQQWLRVHYRTLADLNERWSSAYWSQTYSNWAQVPIPIKHGNPGLFISWMRFVSDTWRSYQKNQIDAIRRYCDHQFITTNSIGWFDGFDHFTVIQDLDLAAWDEHVREDRFYPARHGFLHDLTRGLLQRNFWVMEMQAGAGSFNPVNIALEKGETRAMAWNAVGHGADAIAYWQWRSALNGQEQYAGTLLGADGEPNLIYPEIAQIGWEFSMAGSALADTTVHSQVAIVQSYESRWAIDWQPYNEHFSAVRQLFSYYEPLRRLPQSVDIVSPTTSLEGYKVVIAPGLNILSSDIAKHLADYVENGGHLVLGQRSGMKDRDSQLWQQRQPGPLRDLLGAEVEQYYALRNPVGIDGAWGKGQSELWAEEIKLVAPHVDVLMRFEKSNGWLDGQPAAVTRKVGRGRITYIGAWLDARTMKSAVSWIMNVSHVTPQFPPVPDGVEVYVRSANNKTIYIVINFAVAPKMLRLPEVMYDVLNKVSVRSTMLAHYGIRVFEKNYRR
jgi:beta-galactosidase